MLTREHGLLRLLACDLGYHIKRYDGRHLGAAAAVLAAAVLAAAILLAAAPVARGAVTAGARASHRLAAAAKPKPAWGMQGTCLRAG